MVACRPLWYGLIRWFLENLGYEACPTDQCVFIKQVGEKIFILLFYVDDILGIIDEMEARRLKEHLVKHFGTDQFKEGSRLSFLGIDIEITDTGTKIVMRFYVRQLVEDAEAKKTLVVYNSPGTKESFVSKEDKEKLENERRVYFHSTVAQFLNLPKHARLLILMVVIFLSSIACYGGRYVDAAYAVHNDSKLHTGVIVYVGGKLAYVTKVYD